LLKSLGLEALLTVVVDELVDEALATGLGASDLLVLHARMLRLELLNVKADLERELEDFVLNCSKCGLDVHWVSGLGVHPVTGRTESPRRTASLRLKPRGLESALGASKTLPERVA